MSARDLSDVTPPPRGERWFLKLYPREWRERYGDELSELVGDGPLTFGGAIDLIAGAIDARFAREKKMPAALRTACLTRKEPQTVADALRGAAIIILGAVAFLALSKIAKSTGWPATGETFEGMSVPVSMAIWSHYTYLRKQSETAKWVITGGSLTILTIISIIAAL